MTERAQGTGGIMELQALVNRLTAENTSLWRDRELLRAELVDRAMCVRAAWIAHARLYEQHATLKERVETAADALQQPPDMEVLQRAILDLNTLQRLRASPYRDALLDALQPDAQQPTVVKTLMRDVRALVRGLEVTHG